MTQFTYGLTRLLGHGRAFSEVLSPKPPAAGAGFTYTNEGLYWELLDSISFQLVTSSTSANRQVTLTITDGAGIALATLPSASTQAASLTYQYTWSPDFSNFNTVVANAVTGPLPYIFLQPDYKVKVTVGNIDTTDAITNIKIYAERFVTGESGYLLGTKDLDDPAVLGAVELATLVA